MSLDLIAQTNGLAWVTTLHAEPAMSSRWWVNYKIQSTELIRYVPNHACALLTHVVI